jgi:hypothetical protein
VVSRREWGCGALTATRWGRGEGTGEAGGRAAGGQVRSRRRREVGGNPDRWGPPVGEEERERVRWAGGASWAGKGDGPATCCGCGLKKE